MGNSAFQVEGFSEKTEGAFCHVKIHAQVHSFCGCAIWVSDGDSECCGLVLEISDVLAERALHGVESYAGKLRIRTGKNPCGLISFLGKRRSLRCVPAGFGLADRRGRIQGQPGEAGLLVAAQALPPGDDPVRLIDEILRFFDGCACGDGGLPHVFNCHP